MKELQQQPAGLEQRLRRTFGSLDVSPDFGLRLGAELAALGRGADGSRAARRAQLASERRRAQERLRAQLCWTLVLTLTAGVLAGAFAWSLGRATGGAIATLMANADWTLLGMGSAVALLLWLFVATRRSGELQQLTFG